MVFNSVVYQWLGDGGIVLTVVTVSEGMRVRRRSEEESEGDCEDV